MEEWMMKKSMVMFFAVMVAIFVYTNVLAGETRKLEIYSGEKLLKTIEVSRGWGIDDVWNHRSWSIKDSKGETVVLPTNATKIVQVNDKNGNYVFYIWKTRVQLMVIGDQKNPRKGDDDHKLYIADATIPFFEAVKINTAEGTVRVASEFEQTTGSSEFGRFMDMDDSHKVFKMKPGSKLSVYYESCRLTPDGKIINREESEKTYQF
jgi:hypothetical protein